MSTADGEMHDKGDEECVSYPHTSHLLHDLLVLDCQERFKCLADLLVRFRSVRIRQLNTVFASSAKFDELETRRTQHQETKTDVLAFLSETSFKSQPDEKEWTNLHNLQLSLDLIIIHILPRLTPQLLHLRFFGSQFPLELFDPTGGERKGGGGSGGLGVEGLKESGGLGFEVGDLGGEGFDSVGGKMDRRGVRAARRKGECMVGYSRRIRRQAKRKER